ncbi:MAG: hypothetical protein ACREU7_09425 [Burkholderiales bacterium]
MKDLEHRTMVALAGQAWLDDGFDDADDAWEEASVSPVDQLVAVDQLRAAMTTLRPAYDEL